MIEKFGQENSSLKSINAPSSSKCSHEAEKIENTDFYGEILFDYIDVYYENLI
jgi:hypothetical protein